MHFGIICQPDILFRGSGGRFRMRMKVAQQRSSLRTDILYSSKLLRRIHGKVLPAFVHIPKQIHICHNLISILLIAAQQAARDL